MIFCFALGVMVTVFIGLTAVILAAERHILHYGTCRIDINDGERVLEPEGGDSLISILHEHEIFVPAACGGQATCGRCKVTVRAGGGDVLPTERPFLTRGEIRAGIRLACQLKVTGDLHVHIPEALLDVRAYEGCVVENRDLTPDIKEVTVDVLDPGGIEHHAGQYIQIFIPDSNGQVFRAYSISSPAHHTRRIRLIVRLVPGGVASTHLHGLAPGERLRFAGPYGDFRIEPDPTREVLCIGGGCGMAPMANIVETTLARWPGRPVQLFFGCRGGGDVFYLDKFEAMAAEHPHFKVVYALSEPGAADSAWKGERGFIHLAVDKYVEPGKDRQAFLCGPPAMIEAATQVLLRKGMRKRDIFYDKF